MQTCLCKQCCGRLCFWNRNTLLDRLCDDLQAFIDKFRFNAKRASLVQSRIKAIERLGHSELIEEDPEYIFRFPAAEPVSPPILGFMDVDFGYPGGPTLFRNLNFGIDMESRFAMVGPNGKLFRPQTLSSRLQQHLWNLCYRIYLTLFKKRTLKLCIQCPTKFWCLPFHAK